MYAQHDAVVHIFKLQELFLSPGYAKKIRSCSSIGRTADF